MGKDWTFGRKIAAGYALTVALALMTCVVAVYALRTVVANKDKLLSEDMQEALTLSNMQTLLERRAAINRGLLLMPSKEMIAERDEISSKFNTALQRSRDRVKTAELRAALDDIAQNSESYEVAINRAVDARGAGTPLDDVVKQWESESIPKFMNLRKGFEELSLAGHRKLDAAKRESTDAANFAVMTVIAFSIGAVIAAIYLAWALGRALTRQISSAVQNIQTSSSELQAASNQQTTGIKEQVSAMNEIATTMKELLTTSKQIADSAQRVAHISDDTNKAASEGDRVVQMAQQGSASIRQLVDQVVGHMLDLGKKSQQIGGILEIINELAEQTNILSINASIEAAGAGDGGRRFGVVADEIRKLSDRVGDSTREIRALVDDIRSSVNTTVMATESSSKAVDAGTRQMMEMTSAFGRIASMLETTTEAAREIELSTKQQSTAVEQVNLAVANVAQASRENEASAVQTLQTVAQLNALSIDLGKLVQAEGNP